jgi:hypothetical protein
VRGGFAPHDGAGAGSGSDLAGADQRTPGDQLLPGDLSADLSGDTGPTGGKPAFVLFGVDGRRLVTFDRGETWAVDQADSPLTGDQERWLMGGTWSAKRVVLVGGPWNDPGGYLLHSLDGTSWTEVPITYGQGPLDVAYGNGRFVTVNNVGQTCVSTAGSSFNQCQSGSLVSGRGVCHGQGKFFAAGNSGRISTSTDGVTWKGTELGGGDLSAVACGTDRFVAVSNDRRVTTLDGLTALKDESGLSLGCCWTVAFGKGLFIDGGCNTSADGVTWDPPTSNCSFKAVDFGDGVFLAITDADQVVRSADGRTWTSLGAIPEGPALYHVRFVRFP